jgi:hypothetical protein
MAALLVRVRRHLNPLLPKQFLVHARDNALSLGPGLRIMHPASAPEFQVLTKKMEAEWTPQMMQLLDIDAESLPIIWDADFLYGPRDAAGQDTYVLCEINVSSVFAFPD